MKFRAVVLSCLALTASVAIVHGSEARAPLNLKDLPPNTKVTINDNLAVAPNRGSDYLETFYYQRGSRVDWNHLDRKTDHCLVIFQPKRGANFVVNAKTTYKIGLPTDETADHRFFFREVTGGVTCNLGRPVTKADFASIFGTHVTLNLPTSH